MVDESGAAGGAAGRASLEILPGQVAGRLRFLELFGREAPVELEIGSGKGKFLLGQAEARREVDFLGLEWSLKYLRVAKERAEKRGLSNIRFFRADARHVVADLIGDAAVRRVHVYCPDPWPKKRHRKRRFFTPATTAELERILIPGGYLDLSTDVEEYFAVILQAVRDGTRLVEAVDPLFPDDPATGRTAYEIKYLKSGWRIFRATFRKREAADGPPQGRDSGGERGDQPMSTMISPASTRTG
jgi:tRNA (guanine-N7-)-methyltransferase